MFYIPMNIRRVTLYNITVVVVVTIDVLKSSSTLAAWVRTNPTGLQVVNFRTGYYIDGLIHTPMVYISYIPFKNKIRKPVHRPLLKMIMLIRHDVIK